MIVKKYKEFIKENLDSLGEEIESMYNDDYVRNIVNRYIDKDIDPSIRIANVINIMDDKVKYEIKSQLDNYLNNGIEEKDPTISTSVDINLLESVSNDVISVSGKGVFTSFLKSITALGRKEYKSNYDLCPEDFIIYYEFDNIPNDDIKIVFKRFKSLFRYLDLLDYGLNESNLYFGIKDNGQFEYGVISGERKIIGQFKLNKSTINWILRIESKSSESLKSDIVNLSLSDIILLGKIKKEMSEYSPGYFEKKSPVIIKDKVISFGYYGVGNWNDGKLNETDLISIKSDFNKWILSKKWSDKVLFNINAKSFWINIKLKIK